MKILHITKKYPNTLGGDAVVVENLEKRQLEAGHEVIILTSNCVDTINKPQVYKTGLLSTSLILDKITIKRLISLVMLFFTEIKVIRIQRPDIIHTHSVDMAFVTSIIAKIYKIPTVHTFHILTFNDVNQTYLRRKIELILLRGAGPRIITAPNEYDVNALKIKGFAQATTVSNGIDLNYWKFAPYVKDNEIYTFLSVGRLEVQKGFIYLIEAARILSNSNINFKVVIVGEGSIESTLQSMINEYGLRNIVQLVGKKNHEELSKLYANSDCFIISSLWESAPLTLLESWAMRIPVIATRVGMLKSEDIDRVACMTEFKDSQDLVNVMTKIYNDKFLAAKIVENGYAEVSNNYTWDKIFNKLDNIYKSILNENK